MVFLGLHIDQNHGFVLQNPVNLIGILGIGWMYKLNRSFILVWALVFLSLITPNALHINWYGGGSFSGRFQWAAAITFIIPTIYGLLVIAKSKERIFKAIIAAGALLQLYYFYQYTIIGVDLYNKSPTTFFDSYSIFFYPIHAWMPMLYNSSWAYRYLPNYSWIILISIFYFVGFLRKEKFQKSSFISITILILLLISMARILTGYPEDKLIFKAYKLPSQTGRIIDSKRYAEQNVDKPGFITYGPYLSLSKGSYEVVFFYKSPAKKSEVIGWADVFDARSRNQLTKIQIQGTDNTNSELSIKFNLVHWKSSIIEFRIYWNGTSNIEVQYIELNKNN